MAGGDWHCTRYHSGKPNQLRVDQQGVAQEEEEEEEEAPTRHCRQGSGQLRCKRGGMRGTGPHSRHWRMAHLPVELVRQGQSQQQGAIKA
eukprot:13101580-Alexandrium_andersonii.AAC.1